MPMLMLRQISDSYYCAVELFGQCDLKDRHTQAYLVMVMAAHYAVEDRADPIQAAADRLCAGDRWRALWFIESGLQYCKEHTGLLEFINGGPVDDGITAEWLLERTRAWFQNHAVMQEYDPQDPMGYCRDHDTPREPVFVKVYRPRHGQGT